MADGSACSSCPAEGSPPSGGTTTTTSTMSTAEHEATPVQSKLERRSSKSRLSKQEVVEVAEEMDLPDSSQGQSTSTIGGGSQSGDPAEFRASEVVGTIEESKQEMEEEEDHSPNSDSSDQTVVPAESLASSTATPRGSPKDNSPEDGGIPEVQKNSESDKTSPTQAVNPKVKLVRSQAVYDDASPPPEILIRSAAAAAAASSSSSSIASPLMMMRDSKDRVSPIPQSGSQATLSVSPTFQMRGLGRPRLGQDSSQGSTVSDTSPALSRDSSFETSYTDSTGTNLEEFIIKTLNRKQSDRTMLLHLESDMIAFIKDTSQEKHKFPQMSSYHRMLVHRVAAFFGLDHNVDETGKSVIINRLECTRIPDFKFRDHIRDDLPQDDPPKKFILKRHRDCTSLEETLGTDRVAIDDRMSKSFEERQEEYHEARNRIFQQRDLMQEIGSHPTANRPSNLCGGSSHQSSKDDVRWHPDLRPWNSTDSSGYSTDSSSRLKVYVTKASSFHSVTVLTRGDSRTSTGSSGSRFSKTDSLSSGISNLGSPIVIPPTIPSSPPLEDQEFESGSSDMSAASPSQPKSLAVDPQATGSPFLSFTDDTGEPLAIWVASTIDQIPPGSIIINPQTGEPYINADGTVYRWYPPSEWGATSGDAAEKVLRSGESPDNSSSLSEPLAMVAHQDVDCCAAFHHQFSCMALRSPGGGDSTMPPSDIASSPSSSASHLHHPPQQHVYLFTPGGANPTPSLVAAGTLQRPSLQPVYPVQPPPPHKTSAPFYTTGGGVSAPLHGVQPPHVRYVCQVGYQMPPGPSDTPDLEQGATTPGHHGAPQYGCYPSSGDVCQVMAFPPHQMTIHSVETYPPPSAPPHHLPPDQHGYLPQPPPQQQQPPPQMVPCMYVPQYSSENTATRKVPNQQILYVPAGSYAVDGSGAPVQSGPNQGQVQVIRVNAATSPNGSSQVYYSGQHHQQQQQPGGGGGGGGPAPQYVCYTYPLAEAGHACSASMPLVPSYPGVPMAPAIVRPGFAYPGGPPVGKLQSSSSPKSSSQQQGYQRVARASQGGAEAPTERARETSGGFVPRQHLPGPRLMSVRQPPQVVYPNRPPASFSLGDCRLPMPNVLPVFPNIVRPRTRVPDVNLCESIDASLSAYQSVAATTNVVIEGNNSSARDESAANKGQQRLA